MSSRNAYLTAEERAATTVLSRALRAAADEIVGGERAASPVVRRVRERITDEALVALDYAELVDAVTLTPIEWIDRDALLALAAFVGKARLLDNCAITIAGDDVSIDLGVVAEDC
jgi:pantoate--beta-alanine ligase